MKPKSTWRGEGPVSNYNYDPRHFRFQRTMTRTPVLETHEPSNALLWGAAVVVGVLSVLIIAITG